MPRTCLIAAHDPWLLQLLRIYTEESGFRVVQAHEGQDVLPMIEKEDPAAILLQVDLPGQIKGLELLNVLRTNPLANRIPVLAFSWQNEGVSEMANGAAAYLQEPVTYETFVDALHKLGVCA
jgi:DNA-binding response OmpR family regulator